MKNIEGFMLRVDSANVQNSCYYVKKEGICEISYNYKVLQNPGAIVSELFGL